MIIVVDTKDYKYTYRNAKDFMIEDNIAIIVRSSGQSTYLPLRNVLRMETFEDPPSD